MEIEILFVKTEVGDSNQRFACHFVKGCIKEKSKLASKDFGDCIGDQSPSNSTFVKIYKLLKSAIYVKKIEFF